MVKHLKKFFKRFTSMLINFVNLNYRKKLYGMVYENRVFVAEWKLRGIM